MKPTIPLTIALLSDFAEAYGIQVIQEENTFEFTRRDQSFSAENLEDNFPALLEFIANVSGDTLASVENDWKLAVDREEAIANAAPLNKYSIGSTVLFNGDNALVEEYNSSTGKYKVSYIDESGEKESAEAEEQQLS